MDMRDEYQTTYLDCSHASSVSAVFVSVECSARQVTSTLLSCTVVQHCMTLSVSCFSAVYSMPADCQHQLYSLLHLLYRPSAHACTALRELSYCTQQFASCVPMCCRGISTGIYQTKDSTHALRLQTETGSACSVGHLAELTVRCSAASRRHHSDSRQQLAILTLRPVIRTQGFFLPVRKCIPGQPISNRF